MCRGFFFVFVTMASFMIGCEKKAPEKPVTRQEVQKIQKVESSRMKLEKVRSQTNPKRYKVNMVFITQTGCGACKRIKGYMKEPDVKAYMDKDFIVREEDINFKEDLPFDWMKPFATPTLYFFDEKENEIIDTVVSRLSKDEFMKILKEVIELRDMD